MKYPILATTAIIVFTIACTENQSEQSIDSVKSEEMQSACKYTYQAENVEVGFTAYKLKNKTGVGGTFTKVDIKGATTAASIRDLITGTAFSIPVSSLNTNNPERDGKILGSFFGTMEATEALSGALENAVGDDDKGALDLKLTMNNKTHSVPMNYSVINDTLLLEGSMNVPDWGARSALDSLHMVCAAKHTDVDGTATIWEDVSLKVVVPLSKDCN